ncbi:hypothetical protein DL95DRAFT_381553, partial [Leptodontidium sp. 2 PMI_412]
MKLSHYGCTVLLHNAKMCQPLFLAYCSPQPKQSTSATRKLFLHFKKSAKTYNSRYSLVVTHPTTNLPIWCLCMAERTGCPVLTSL